MARLSRELKSQGRDIIDLSLGEPDFDTPTHIKDAAKLAIDQDYTHYTPVAGYLELREAIVGKLKRDNQLIYSPEQVVVSTGAKQSLANVIMSLVNPGDEVILPAPYWVSYRALLQLAGAEIKVVQTGIEQDYKMKPDQLRDAITSKTKMLIYSSPCNPSGAVYSKEELAEFAKIIEGHNSVYVISDEIYEYINYTSEHQSIAQFESIKDQVIVVNGLSKGFAMTGWRLGYIAAPEWIAKACDKMQGQITSGTCSITQRAAIEALSAQLDSTFEMVEAFRKRRDLVIDLMKTIPDMKVKVPEGAFYVFPEVSSYFGKSDGEKVVTDASELCLYLLNEANIALVTGKAFGVDNYIRISYAASDEVLVSAINRMKDALSKLN